jgi:hypothetical protein
VRSKRRHRNGLLGACLLFPPALFTLVSSAYAASPTAITRAAIHVGSGHAYLNRTVNRFRIVTQNSSSASASHDDTFATPSVSALSAPCTNEALREEQHATSLPDCRAYELASPPDKNGGNVSAVSGRTRAAVDGSAVGFASLSAFGDATGTGLATEYISVRSKEGPGSLGTGWVIHAITPFQESQSFETIEITNLEPRFLGEFTPNLGVGAFFADSPLTDDPSVDEVPNLYLRDDLRNPGHGNYRLLTACPRCVEKGTELPAPNGLLDADAKTPYLDAISPDGRHVVFESGQRLTSEPSALIQPRVFEWEDGALRLAGRLPSGTATECDDLAGPTCNPGDLTFAGQGANNHNNEDQAAPDVLSDGSDGHTRIFVTRPTGPSSTVLNAAEFAGQLYVREDGHYTAQLNASERTPAEGYAAAIFWDASTNGERAFFTSKQALTADNFVGSNSKLYMYDASKPGSAPDNLTFLSPDAEPADGSGGFVTAVIGVSEDGHYIYFIAEGQLVAGAPLLGSERGIYLWHDGTVSYVGRSPGGFDEQALRSAGGGPGGQRQARITPNGQRLLFLSPIPGAPAGPSQLYVYDAQASQPAAPRLYCASCRSDFSLPTTAASDVISALRGGSKRGTHENHALSVDGSRVFFSTAEPLIPEDTNDKSDAYEYDVAGEEVHLLSSGTDSSASWFLDASADGSDAFILTAQQLLGWDHDSSYDLYDVRVGGGFPEPAVQPAPCNSPETCKEALAPTTSASTVGSTIESPGNSKPKRPACPKGKLPKKSHGHTICVKKTKRSDRNHGRRVGGVRQGAEK